MCIYIYIYIIYIYIIYIYIYIIYIYVIICIYYIYIYIVNGQTDLDQTRCGGRVVSMDLALQVWQTLVGFRLFLGAAAIGETRAVGILEPSSV